MNLAELRKIKHAVEKMKSDNASQGKALYDQLPYVESLALSVSCSMI